MAESAEKLVVEANEKSESTKKYLALRRHGGILTWTSAALLYSSVTLDAINATDGGKE